MPSTKNDTPDLTTPETKEDYIKPRNEPVVQEESSSEYATKEPLLTKKNIIKIGIGLLGLFGLGIIILFVVAFLNRPKTIQPDPVVIPDIPVIIDKPVTEDLPQIAYIKNENSIWTTNINGENKTNLINLPNMNDNNSLITSLSWKSKDVLTYAQCTAGKDSGCSIMDLSTKDNSRTTVVNASKATTILNEVWSPDRKTLAYIEVRGGNTYFNLKSGNVVNPVESFLYTEDKTKTKSRIIFTPDNEYVIFYGQKVTAVEDPKKKGSFTYSDPVDTIVIYRLNGIKVDEIANASDPFLIDANLIGYYKNNGFSYKEIGSNTETLITNQAGLNPVISPNKKLIAFWSNETAGSKKIVLQIFDTELNIRRDILRGIVLPTWLTNNQIAGIKLDSCLGENCLLYEFQTAGFVIVNTDTSRTTVVDQGDSISDITLNTNAN